MPFFKLQIIVFFPSFGINDVVVVVVVVVDHANDSHLSSTCKFIHEVLSLMLYKVVTENTGGLQEVKPFRISIYFDRPSMWLALFHIINLSLSLSILAKSYTLMLFVRCFALSWFNIQRRAK